MTHYCTLTIEFLCNLLIYYILTPFLYIILFPIYCIGYVYDMICRKDVPKPKSILITGASSGIGEHLAYYYASHGAEILYIFGQNKERLEKTKEKCLALNSSMIVKTYVGDITNEKEFLGRLDTIKQIDNVDLVIANAGRGVVAEMTSESLLNDADISFKLNILAAVHTVLPFVDQMKSRKCGQLAVVSSANGYGNLFMVPSYESSKNCVRVYFEGLQNQLRPFGIHVNIISPGPVDTRFSENQNQYPLCYTAEKAATYIAEQLAIDTPFIAFPQIYHVIFYTLGRQVPSAIGQIITRFTQWRSERNMQSNTTQTTTQN
ncbi:hypothetical protein WA158_003216 [Blastocystis sp. Blastoise]